MEGPTMFVERYTVVPAVDVEALRAALLAVAVGDSVTVALGPSLLGTLDMDALLVGMHPFVDPDRRVRPLRDDVVLLSTEPDPGRADALAGTAGLVERGVLDPGPVATARGGVLLLVRADGPDGVRLSAAVAEDPPAADSLLPEQLAAWFGSAWDGGLSVGADLYALLSRDRLAQVLALRDG